MARVGDSKGEYRVLVRRPEGKRQLGISSRRWENNFKMDLQEVGCGDVEWVDDAQNRERLPDLLMR